MTISHSSHSLTSVHAAFWQQSDLKDAFCLQNCEMFGLRGRAFIRLLCYYVVMHMLSHLDVGNEGVHIYIYFQKT